MLIRGFEPVVGRGATVIILGTLPGDKSLAVRQYYADPKNAFWFIVEKLFGIARSASYDQRCQQLIERRVAIWDVLKQAERETSADRKIKKGTEKANDFVGFFRKYPSVKTVFFNGHPAEKYFADLVLPRLRLAFGTAPQLWPALLSTSGGNSHATREAKAEKWRDVRSTNYFLSG